VHALLLAEDPDESAILELLLQRLGLTVSTGRDLEHAVRVWSEHPADLVLLALTRPHPRDQVRQLRAHTACPLIMIINWADEELQAALLDMGADVLLTRPYSVRLLMAQARALLRRAVGLPSPGLPSLRIAGLTLHPETRSVEVPGRPVQRLTALEFRLLYNLILYRGQVLPTQTLVDRVWGYRSNPEDRDLVRGLISRLRAKIEPDPRHPRYVLTVPGVGYVLRQEEALDQA